MRACVTLMWCWLAAGCGGDDEPPRLPTFSDLGGPRMAHPGLVLVFYSDDPEVDAVTRYGEWLVASSWLDQVGAEYGVGTGSILAVVRKTEPVTTCEDCASQIGCGFCSSNGQCMPDGIGGSADGSCSGSAFARWPGSCLGFCARFSGSCTDCSSQAGCGWCASGGTGQCLEAGDTYAGPAAASCAYADWAFTPDYCSP